eukprot:TRINITY_DN16406_c0_g1_i1.p1 TRINITY_DN16406_c0_g1~~TRINITY_DN16406_c0_g1_i1.p1  ORF type:complete len:186 (-),score=30.32 TRINITY_DN16406_c0_g1_i1:95-652(-)
MCIRDRYMGRIPKASKILHHFYDGNVCEMLELTLTDREYCENLGQGILKRGIAPSIQKFFTNVKDVVELISIGKVDVDEVIDTAAIGHHLSISFQKITKILVEEIVDMMAEVQMWSIVLTTTIYLVLAVVIFLAFLPLSKELSHRSQAPFKLLQMLPNELILQNSYVRSLLARHRRAMTDVSFAN